MLRRAVDATRGDQAHQVYRVALGGRPHGGAQHRGGGETTVLDGAVDSGEVLEHDAAGADVEVTDLGVPLLALGQADRETGGGQRRMRPPLPQGVPVRRLGRCDRVPDSVGAVSPAVDDHQHEGARRRTVHARADWTTSAVARTIAVKSPAFKLAPPTSAPSICGFSIKLRAFAGLTLPPQRM